MSNSLSERCTEEKSDAQQCVEIGLSWGYYEDEEPFDEWVGIDDVEDGY